MAQLQTLNHQLGQDSGWAHKITKHTVLDPAVYAEETEKILQHFRNAVSDIEI